MRIAQNVVRLGPESNRNQARRLSLRLLAVVAGFSLPGCRNANVCIVDVRTQEVIEISLCEKSPQHVMAVNDGASEFSTFCARGKNAGVRVYGYDGKEKRVLFPAKLQRGSEVLSVSEDGTWLAYLDVNARHLYAYNMNNQKESRVYPYISSFSQWDSIAGIAWLTGERFLVLLNQDGKAGRERATIEVVDISTKQRRTLFHPKYINPFYNAYAISDDKKKLAFCDGERDEVVIKCLELDSGQLLYSGRKGRYRNIRWLRSGDCIGYVSDGHKINVLSLSDKKEDTLLTMPQNHTIMHLVFGEAFFAADAWDLGVQKDQVKVKVPMAIYDMGTKHATVLRHSVFMGDWFAADKGRKIICEKGY